MNDPWSPTILSPNYGMGKTQVYPHLKLDDFTHRHIFSHAPNLSRGPSSISHTRILSLLLLLLLLLFVSVIVICNNAPLNLNHLNAKGTHSGYGERMLSLQLQLQRSALNIMFRTVTLRLPIHSICIRAAYFINFCVFCSNRIIREIMH